MKVGRTYQHKTLTNLHCVVLDYTNRGVKVRQFNPYGKKKDREGVIKFYYKTDYSQWEEMKEI